MAPRVLTLLSGSGSRSDAYPGFYGDVTDVPIVRGALPGRPFHGPKALLFAVLDDGIRCYFSDNPRIRRDAEHWIGDPRGRGPFAFESLCELFSLDANAVRQSLDRLRAESYRPRSHARPRGPRKRRLSSPSFGVK